MNKPLVPEDLLKRARPSDHLVRAVLAYARASYTTDRNPVAVVRNVWPDDKVTLQLVSRAATTPATTSDPAWAGALAQSAVADLLVSLGPASAGSQLLKAALVLDLGRNASLTVPGIVAAAGNVGFVSQGQPIPIRELDTSQGTKLEPRELKAIFSLTREMIEGSNAQALTKLVMTESGGRGT
jgi:hypothetical protein